MPERADARLHFEATVRLPQPIGDHEGVVGATGIRPSRLEPAAVSDSRTLGHDRGEDSLQDTVHLVVGEPQFRPVIRLRNGHRDRQVLQASAHARVVWRVVHAMTWLNVRIWRSGYPAVSNSISSLLSGGSGYRTRMGRFAVIRARSLSSGGRLHRWSSVPQTSRARSSHNPIRRDSESRASVNRSTASSGSVLAVGVACTRTVGTLPRYGNDRSIRSSARSATTMGRPNAFARRTSQRHQGRV